VIGYLSSRSPDTDVAFLAAIRQGLDSVGYVENRNVAIEYRFADGQYDRPVALAAELVRLRVAVILSAGVRSQRAQRASPDVFDRPRHAAEYHLHLSAEQVGQSPPSERQAVRIGDSSPFPQPAVQMLADGTLLRFKPKPTARLFL
jgi:hypothetical protein